MTCKCDYYSETFENCLDAYLSSIKNHRTAVEYGRYVAIICRFLQKDFLDIDSSDALRFFEYMEGRIYSGSIKKTTYNSRRSCYNKVAAYIVENYPQLEYENAFLPVMPEAVIDARISPVNIPSLKDIDALLNNARTPMFRLIFCMAFRVGLTVSEILRLCLHNIQNYDEKLCIHFPPKNSFVEDRVIVLPEDISIMMQNYIRNLSCADSDGHLFYNKYGNPLTLRNLNREFNTSLQNSGINKHFTLRDFRSRAILDMLNAAAKNGAEPSVVCDYVGIKGLRLNTYVSATSIVGDCPAELVNIRVKSEEESL